MIKQIVREFQLLPHLLKGGHQPSGEEVEKFFLNKEIVSMQSTCAKCETPIEISRSSKNPDTHYISRELSYVNVNSDNFIVLKTTMRDGSSSERVSSKRN